MGHEFNYWTWKYNKTLILWPNRLVVWSESEATSCCSSTTAQAQEDVEVLGGAYVAVDSSPAQH